MQRICPNCAAPLAEVAVGPCAVDLCPCCGGVWFDSRELSRLVRESPRELAAVDRAGPPPAPGIIPVPKLCPACRQGLIPFPFQGSARLLADRCSGCRGIWLDGGKIRQVREHLGLAAFSAQPPPPPGKAGRSLQDDGWQLDLLGVFVEEILEVLIEHLLDIFRDS